MPEEQLREPMASPHQITTRVLTRPHEITCGLLFRRGDPHRRDLTKPKQSRQPLGITPVGLDAITCSSDPRRGRDHTVDPHRSTGAREPVPSRSRLVHNPHRRRQRLQPRDGRRTTRRQPQRPHLAAPLIDHTRDNRASMHIESDPATFTHNRRLP
jgi:hypothetical protein